jgi:hypothetical protein
MNFPDLTTKIKVNDKLLLNEKMEVSSEEKGLVKEKKGPKNEEKLSEYVAILLSKPEKECLEKVAAKEERSVSYMVRKAIKATYKV